MPGLVEAAFDLAGLFRPGSATTRVGSGHRETEVVAETRQQRAGPFRQPWEGIAGYYYDMHA